MSAAPFDRGAPPQLWPVWFPDSGFFRDRGPPMVPNNRERAKRTIRGSGENPRSSAAPDRRVGQAGARWNRKRWCILLLAASAAGAMLGVAFWQAAHGPTHLAARQTLIDQQLPAGNPAIVPVTADAPAELSPEVPPRRLQAALEKSATPARSGDLPDQ